MKRWSRLLACFALIAIQMPVWAVNYDRISLGALGLYPDKQGNLVGFSRVSGINNWGQVVGLSSLSTREWAAFIWTPTDGMAQLASFTGTDYQPGEITDTGKVLFSYGYYDILSNMYSSTPYRTSGINDSGEICANYENGGYAFPKFMDQSGNWIDLESLQGFPYGSNRTVDMNASGQVCGWAYDRSTNRRTALLWNPSGVLVNIGVPDGYQTSESKAINDSGWILGDAGYYQGSTWYYDPFIWHSDFGFTMLSNKASSRRAMNINNQNQVVGYFPSTGGTTTGWVWDAHKGFTYLPNLWPLGINENGWIIGNSVENYQERAVLLQPVPELSSLAVLFSTGFGLAVMRRRSR